MALTAKQEAFAQAVASGMNQSDAYRAAYDTARMKATSINVNASKMMADAKVSQRVEALRKPVVEAMQYGLKEAMEEAAEAMELCRETRQSGAFVSAVALRAKLSGLLIDKKEVRTGELEGLQHDELKQLRDTLAAIGGGGSTQGAFSQGSGGTTH